MKATPHLAVGLIACAALAAGYVMATEDRAVFDTEQALIVWPDDAQGAAPAQGRDASGRPVAFPQQ